MSAAKSMKTSVKLIAAFSIVALLCCLVGITSILMSSVTNQAARDSEALNGMASRLLQAANAHMAWKNGLEETFLRNLDTVGVEIDGHKCAYGKWFYGDEFAAFEKLSPDATKFFCLF